jgi:hypothetical protein
MRTMVLMGLALATLARPGWSEDIYRWQDPSGRVVYSNSVGAEGATRIPGVSASPPAASRPAPGREPLGEVTPPDVAAPAAAPAKPRSDDELAALSTSASLRRTQLERDLRDTARRLAAIDARLRELGGARTRNAAGSAATGGVGTGALDLRSDEEQALQAERDELAQHADDVRARATQLRAEVSQALGGTPAWWTDVR